MSYDVKLEINTGGEYKHEIVGLNITSNVGGMFIAAFTPLGRDHGIRSVDGLLASMALPRVVEAIERMEGDPAYYRAMNPANGWGDSLSAYVFLTKLRDACIMHPATTIRVSA